MRIINIYDQDHDWLINVFVAVTTYHVDEILEMLTAIGCPRHERERVRRNMASGHLNTGLCYSNLRDRISTIVISKTTSSGQFLNSLTHEITHLATHMAQADGIEMGNEELCYIAGDIAERLYEPCHDLLCCKCRR